MGNFISYELLPIVFNMSVTASVVIAFVLLARLLLKKVPKIFSYALWVVVLFRLLCPVSVTAGFSLLGLVDAPVTEATTHTTMAEYVPQDVVHIPFPEVQLPAPGISQAVNEALPQGQEQTAADPLEAPAAIATLVWLAGIASLAVYSVLSYLRLRRALVGAVLLRDNIYLADHIDTPFVMGLFRPKIYLPSSLPEREQPYILLHEQHHIRRLDHIVKVLAFLALCIHWFNPLVWLAFVLAGKDMEMSCDEAVVKKLGEEIRSDYSASLLSLATGRHIIAGTPLAFGEGDPKSRIRNLLSWKRPRLWITVAAVVVCAAVVAACAGNPKASGPAQAGEYASMEDFAQRTMDGAKTAHYYRSDGGEATANVTGTKLAWLEKQGEVDGLAPEGTLEAWTFNYLVQVVAAPDQIMLPGGMYEEDGWYDLEGQGGHNVVALRYPDGSYDILYNAVVNDNLDFYGYHHSYEEAIYDWYVTENGLDLPLYMEDWIDRITVPEGGNLGNYPVHRYDGDGWYIYVPVSAWEQAAASADIYRYHWEWRSGYDTGSTLIVNRFTQSVEDNCTVSQKQGFTPTDSTNQVWERYQDGIHETYYLCPCADGGSFRVWTRWSDAGITDYPYIAMEPEVLRLMAESFTVDSRIHQAAESSGEPLSAEEIRWFNEWFQPIVEDKQGNAIGLNAICCFFTSYYDDVRELDFEEFMRYFPGDSSKTSEAEFEALRGLDVWPFGSVDSLENMPVPVHKYPQRLVDLILGEYAGISTEDLDTSRVAYLPEYDAYYNYTSDAGFGTFTCTRGERDGDLVRLYDASYDTKLLTLRQISEKNYQIVSYQLLESSAD